MENDKFGVINQKGKEIIPPTYDRVKLFSEGVAPVQLDGKWGILTIK